MYADINSKLVEVMYILMLDDLMIANLKHAPELSIWNKVLLLEKLNLRWKVVGVGLVTIGQDVQDHSVCAVEPINHQFKLEKGMVLICEDAK